MAITTLSFAAFVTLVVAFYYLLPKRFQWCVLLIASMLFYISFGIKNIVFILITATTIYLAARWMFNITTAQKRYFKENKENLTKEEKTLIKQKNNIKRKAIFLVSLLLNLGILCVFKYGNFILDQVNSVFSWFGFEQPVGALKFLVPLGISFYTFQSIGYLTDVYWEHYDAEKNYFKTLLFVSFFPQITQGPISEFSTLSNELFTPHSFSYENFSKGFQRMLWGFMKKMLIADVLAPYVADAFVNHNEYAGIVVLFSAFMYSVQIYADFSGYMDIMCGICQMLGIKLTENFMRPYFSKSIAEYWRRWHISLGNWFKKYIYYPIGMSTWSRKFAKNNREKYGKHFSDNIPATVALVVTWTATGLWHGASWEYITWGIVNGLFIIVSLWLEPIYATCKSKLKINEKAWLWRAFQTIRTFFLVTMIKVFPEVGGFKEGFSFLKRIFTNFSIPNNISSLLPFVNFGSMQEVLTFLICIVFTGVLFITSLLQRKQPVRSLFNKIPMVLRVAVLAILAILLIAFGVPATWGGGGFMYANF